ncbi:MAG: hypothetical protein ACPGPF_07530 [Pontibacterium sp.]
MYLVITHLPNASVDLSAIPAIAQIPSDQLSIEITNPQAHAPTAILKISGYSVAQMHAIAKSIYGTQFMGHRIYAYSLLLFR